MNFRSNASYEEIIALLSNNKQVRKTFRYYNTRAHKEFNSHQFHAIFEDQDQIVGYGHLDREERLWLGMFVVDSQRGLGYGKKILRVLIRQANDDVYLTVDKTNISAINLYLHNGFRITDQTADIFVCKKEHEHG